MHRVSDHPCTCFPGQADRNGSMHPIEAGAGCSQLSTVFLFPNMKGRSAANIGIQKEIVASKASEALSVMLQFSWWKDEMVVTSLSRRND